MDEITVDDRLDEWADAWRACRLQAPADQWRAECEADWAEDAVLHLESLDTPDWRAARVERDALARSADAWFAALALALRDRRHGVWTGALDALTELGPSRRAELESALCSLVETPPPAAYEGAPASIASRHRGVTEHAWSADGLARLAELTRDPRPVVASGAAFVLGRPRFLAEGMEALSAWSLRDDLPESALDLLEHLVPALESHLGVPRSGDARIERLRSLLATSASG